MPRTILGVALLAIAFALTTARADAAVSSPAIQDRTLFLAGDASADRLALRVSSTLEIDDGDDGTVEFRVARARFDRVVARLGDGDDSVRVVDAAVKGVPPLPVALEGQNGADTLSGGRAADTLDGGAGNDRIDAGAGDAAEGREGFDRLSFEGGDAAEQYGLAAAGPRARLTRDGAPVLDAGGVERIDLATLGGADRLTVDALTGTGVQEVRPDLGAATDRVFLNGTAAADITNVLPSGGGIAVLGLPAFAQIAQAEELTVNTLGGNDRIEAGSLAAPQKLTADGGAGADALFGGAASDVLIGGDGDDFVDGGRGDDVALLGAGDDDFRADASDGSDIVERQAGADRMGLHGSSAGEQFAVGANGIRVRVTRGGATALDAGGVESLDLLSFGGADRFVFDDLSGSALTAVHASLFDFGVPGGNTDTVVVNATNGDDDVVVGNGTVTGLAAKITLTGTTAVNDRLEVNGRAGNDSISATDLPEGAIRFLSDGGAGDDVLLGGDGADVIFAGKGDNVALGGPGDDVLRGEEGDDVLDGGAGEDILIGNAGDDVLLNGEVVFDD